MKSVDYASFAERLAAREDRWGLMTEFQKTWKIPRTGAEIVSTATLDRAEKRLGFAIPLALREWYQLPGNPYRLKPRIFWSHMVWPKELAVWPARASKKGLIVFKTEYQNCCEWAFRVADAHLDDPPVYYGSTDSEVGQKPDDWQLQADTISGFFLQLLMVRSVDFACTYHACKTKVPATDWKRLGKHFADVGFPPWLEYGEKCRLFGGTDCLLLTRTNPPWGSAKDLVLNAHSAEARQNATDATGLKWDHVQDIKKPS